MKIIGKCGQCKKKKLFVKKRIYTHHIVGPITSKDELCGSCWSKIKKSFALDKEANPKTDGSSN